MRLGATSLSRDAGHCPGAQASRITDTNDGMPAALVSVVRKTIVKPIHLLLALLAEPVKAFKKRGS